jgi:hypothetical protein
MEEFDEQFLSGFAWLYFHGHAVLELDEKQRVQFVGVKDVSEQMTGFPSAARLAFIAVRDSLAEIRSKEGGTGMDALMNVFDAAVPAGRLLVKIRDVMEEYDAGNQ